MYLQKASRKKNAMKKFIKRYLRKKKIFYFGKSKIYETDGFSFSASYIINNFLDIYPEETKGYLKSFSKQYSFNDIAERLNKLKDLKVLLIGDGIIDEYHYCTALGKSAKSHLVVSKYITHEVFAGGAFAIANHLAGLCDSVKLVTLLGSQSWGEDFVLKSLKQNIDAKFFYRDDGPTIVKKRYVDQYLNQKILRLII